MRVALATNPLFPSIAPQTRIRWTGLEPEDFEFFTTHENIGWCKPNPDYYRKVLRWADLKAEDCLINKAGEDIDKYPHGNFDELKRYVESLVAPDQTMA